MATTSINFHDTSGFKVSALYFPPTAERGGFHITKIEFVSAGAIVEMSLYADDADAFGDVFNVSQKTLAVVGTDQFGSEVSETLPAFESLALENLRLIGEKAIAKAELIEKSVKDSK